jgi:hypothetical protein
MICDITAGIYNVEYQGIHVSIHMHAMRLKFGVTLSCLKPPLYVGELKLKHHNNEH